MLSAGLRIRPARLAATARAFRRPRAEGCQIQLLLNHEHLDFMESAMARLAVAS
jgi:hypothetical protein